MVKDTKTLKEMTERKLSRITKTLNTHVYNGFIRGALNEVSIDSISQKDFYQKYLIRNKPVMVKDGAKDWLGMAKWQDKEYIIT